MAIEPGVGAVVLGEVVVRRVLAAEQRAGLGHPLLDERVTDPGADRRAAVLADHLGHGLRADQVVEDRRARVRCAASTADRIAVVVEPLRPVPVSSTTKTRSASPSNARPTSKPPDTTRARRSRWFAGCSGSAGWFGNVPSSSRVHHLEVEHAEALEHGRHDEPTHPVRGVGDDAARAQRGDVDERHDVVGERRQQVLLGAPCPTRPPASDRGRRARPGPAA